MGDLFEETLRCPLANFCERTSPDAPACGTEDDHLPQLVPAEHLCTRALTRRIALEASQAPEPYVLWNAKHTLRAGWLQLERALQPKIEYGSAADSFDDASIYASRVLENTEKNFAVKRDATLLQIYLPAFIARREGSYLPQSAALRIIRRNIAALTEEARAAEVHTQRTHPNHLTAPEHSACFASAEDQESATRKLGMLLLSNRSRLTYPASCRESSLHGSGKRQPLYSHDMYFLSEDSKNKIPLHARTKLKRRQGGNPSVISLSYDALSQRATKKVMRSSWRGSAAESADKSITWLIDEAKGDALSAYASKILNTMSSLLSERIIAFRTGRPLH